MFRILLYLLVAISAVTGLVIGMLNPVSTELDLLWFRLQWPLGLYLVLAFAAGLSLGCLLTWALRVLPARWAARRQRAQSAHDVSAGSKTSTGTALTHD